MHHGILQLPLPGHLIEAISRGLEAHPDLSALTENEYNKQQGLKRPRPVDSTNNEDKAPAPSIIHDDTPYQNAAKRPHLNPVGMAGPVATGSSGESINLDRIKQNILDTERYSKRLLERAQASGAAYPFVDASKTVDAFAKLAMSFASAGDEDSAFLWANSARHAQIIANDLFKASAQAIPRGFKHLVSMKHLQDVVCGQADLALRLYDVLQAGEHLDFAKMQTLAGHYHADALAIKQSLRDYFTALKAMPREQAMAKILEDGTVVLGDFALLHQLTSVGQCTLSMDLAVRMEQTITDVRNFLKSANPFAKEYAAGVVGIQSVAFDLGTEACEEALALLKETPELLVQEGTNTAQVVNEAAEVSKIINEASPTVNDVTNIVSENALPNFRNAKIDIRKLSEYALNPDHPVGGHKARVFESALGYKKDHANALLDQIYKKLPQYEAIPGRVDQFGQRYTVDIQITGINGNATIVRTGWILKQGSTIPELTTLFIK